MFNVKKRLSLLHYLAVLLLLWGLFANSHALGSENPLELESIKEALREDNLKQLKASLKGHKYSTIYLDIDPSDIDVKRSDSNTQATQPSSTTSKPLLHAAVILKAKRSINWLVKQSANSATTDWAFIAINQLDNQNYSPLSYSLITQQFAIAELLVKYGANVNQVISEQEQQQLNTRFGLDYGLLPQLIFDQAEIAAIDWLIERNGKLASESGNKNIYGLALVSGHQELIQRFLSLEPVPFQQPYIGGSINGIPIVMIACFTKSTEFIAKALNRGLNVNLNYNQLSLLNLCITQNNLPMIAKLVEHGAHILNSDIRKAASTDSAIYQYLSTTAETKKQQMVNFLSALKTGNLASTKQALANGMSLNHDFSMTSSNCADCLQSYEISTHFPNIDYSVQTPFLMAVAYGDVTWLTQLIELGADVNYKTQSKVTPLSLALSMNDVEKIQLLTENGAHLTNYQVAVLLNKGLFTYTTAYIEQNPEWINYWLENQSGYISDVIEVAIKTEQLTFLQSLVNAGFSFDQTKTHIYPINIAIATGNASLVKLVVGHSQDMERYQYGNSPIELAISIGKNDLVGLLAEAGFKLSAFPDEELKTQLFSYLINFPKDIVTLLCSNAEFDPFYSLEPLININNIATLVAKCGRKMDNNWQSFNWLSELLKKSRFEQAKLLIEYGLDPNYRAETYSSTHLEIAIKEGRIETVKFLVEHGINIGLKDSTITHPIVLALQENKTAIALYLTQQLTQQVSEQSDSQHSINANAIIQEAIAQTAPDILQLLLDKGINLPPNILKICNESTSVFVFCFQQQIGNLTSSQLNQKLAEAIYDQQIEATEQLLKLGADPNLSGIGNIAVNETLLMNATENANSTLVALLIQYGADPNQKISSQSALDYAVRSGNKETLALLLQSSTILLDDPSTIAEIYVDLSLARNTKLILWMLSQSYAPPKRLLSLTSPWMDIASFRTIINSQAPNYWTNDDFTKAIESAVASGYAFKLTQETDANVINVLNYLFTLGGDPFDQISPNGFKADPTYENNLSASLQRGSITTVNWLIDKGVKLPTEFNDYATAMELLTKQNDHHMLQKLLRIGANPNVFNGEVESLLVKALMMGNESIIRLFLEHGADTNISSKEHSNYTPLLISIDKQMLNIVTLLLEYGADANKRASGEKGLSPLMLAVERGSTSMVTLLLDNGANPTAQDRNGRSIIDRATKTQLPEIHQLITQSIKSNENSNTVQLSIAKATANYKIEDQIVENNGSRKLSLRRFIDHTKHIDFIELWDDNNDRAIRTLSTVNGFNSTLSFAKFINSRQAIISYEDQRMIKTYDLISGEVISILNSNGKSSVGEFSTNINSAAITKDRKTIAIATNFGIKLIKLNDRSILKEWDEIAGESIEFLDDDQAIGVIAEDQNFTKLSLVTEDRLEFDHFYDDTIKEPSFIVQVDSDNFLLASGSFKRDKVWLWDHSANQIRHSYHLGFANIKSIQLSAAKTHFLSLTDQHIIYWNLEKNAPDWKVKLSDISDTYAADHAVFLDEQHIAIVDHGSRYLEIINLETKTRTKKITLPDNMSINSVVVLNNDQLVYLDANNKTINQLNWKTETQVTLIGSAANMTRIIANGNKHILAFSKHGEIANIDIQRKEIISQQALITDAELSDNCDPNLGRGAILLKQNHIIFECNTQQILDNRKGLYQWSFDNPIARKIESQWSSEFVNDYKVNPETNQLYIVGSGNRSNSYFTKVDLNSDDYPTSRLIKNTSRTNQSINALAVNNKTLLSGSSDKMELLKWELNHENAKPASFEKLQHKNNVQTVSGIAISLNGSRSINWQTNWAEIWDIETKQLLSAIQIEVGIITAKFSNDGSSVYVSGQDNSLYRFDSVTGEKRYQSSPLPDWTHSIDVSSDGSNYLTAARNVQLWDSIDHQLISEYKVAIGQARKAFFSLNGKTLLVGIVSELDEAENTVSRVEVIDIASGDIIASHADMTLLAQSNDRSQFVTQSSDNKIHIWDHAGTLPVKSIEHSQKVGWNEDAAINKDSLFLSGNDYIIQHALVDDKKTLLSGNGIPFEREMAYSEDRNWALKLDSNKRSVWYSVRDNQQLGCIDDNLTGFDSISIDPKSKSLVVKADENEYRIIPRNKDCSSPIFNHHKLTLSASGGPAVRSDITISQRPRLTGPTTDIVPLWSAKAANVGYQVGLASMAVIAPDHSRIAFAQNNILRVLSLQTGQLMGPISAHAQMVGLRFSETGEQVVVLLRDGSFKLIDSDSGISLMSAQTHFSSRQSIEFIKQNTQLQIASYYISKSHRICDPFCNDITDKIMLSNEIWDISSGKRLQQTVTESTPKKVGKTFTRTNSQSNTVEIKTDSIYQRIWWGHENGVVSDDGNLLAQFNDDKINIWNKQQRPIEIKQDEGIQTPSLMAFINNNQHFVSVDKNGLFTFYNAVDGHKIAEIHVAEDSSWLALDQEGRYDSNKPGDIPFAAWVSDDSPLEALPIEVFMNDFFKPRLIPSILSRETLPAINTMSAINRIRPVITIESIELQPNGEKIDVTVSVTEVENQQRINGEIVSARSGFKGIRLFRNGHQVGYSSESSGTQEQLNGANQLTSKRITFTDIQIPNSNGSGLLAANSSLAKAEIELSAYAFNIDNIKSATVRKKFELPAQKHTRKPKAYVVTIGVNAYNNTAWDLTYAVPDADAIHKTVVASLTKTNNYRKVVGINLSTSDKKLLPNKALIEEVFHRLSGPSRTVAGLVEASANKQFTDWPELDELERVHPDDTILVSYAGHGYASADGDFHLFPKDIAAGNERKITPELLRTTITSTDLNRMLRGIDSENFMVIIDACNSAASIEGKDFRPGPMGSSGLGQIAYNKQMMILTASQAEELALESDELNHGLLTYSLIEEGLKSQSADVLPRDNSISAKEWLSYGLKRVPDLYKSLVNNNLALNNSRGIKVKPVIKTTQPDVEKQVQSIQQPGLFDYSQKAKLVISDY